MDYLINNDLSVFLLEINKGPELNFFNKIDYKLKYDLLEDMLNKLNLIYKKK